MKFKGRSLRSHDEKMFLFGHGCTLRSDVFLVVCRVVC